MSSKFITAETGSLQLRLLWAGRRLESIIIEDHREPCESPNAVSLGAEAVLLSAWERFKLGAYFAILEDAAMAKDQLKLKLTLAQLAKDVAEHCAIDTSVTLKDSASAWVLEQAPLAQMAQEMASRSCSALALVRQWEDKAEAANVAFRKPDWRELESLILAAAGMRPARGTLGFSLQDEILAAAQAGDTDFLLYELTAAPDDEEEASPTEEGDA